jgi:hypothetical protein
MKSILQAVLKFRHTAFLDIITVCEKLFLCTMQTPRGREIGMLIKKNDNKANGIIWKICCYCFWEH